MNKIPIVIYPDKPVQVPFYKIYFPWLDLAILAILLYGQVWLTSPLKQYKLMSKGVTVAAKVTNKEYLARNGGLMIQDVRYTFSTKKGQSLQSAFISPYGMYRPLDKDKNTVAIVYLPSNPSLSQDKQSLAQNINDLIVRIILMPFVFVLIFYVITAFSIREEIEAKRLNRFDKKILGFD